MSTSVYSSMPRTEFRGTKDDSAVAVAMPVSSLPIHLPLFFVMSPWGEETRARYVNAAALSKLYGDEVLDVNSPFYTHQSRFVQTNFEAGASAMVLRLVDESATQASLRFSLDVVADKIPQYERNADNTFRRDAQGNKIPLLNNSDPVTVDGYRIRVNKGTCVNSQGQNTFGTAAPSEGNFLSGDTGETSTLYPLMDMMARFRGARGNNLGVRLIAPTVNSVEPANATVVGRVGSALFRMQQIQRKDAKSSPTTLQTLDSDNSVTFSFTKNAKDPDTNIVYDGAKILIPSWEGRTPAEFNGWGNIEKLKIYNSHLDTLLSDLAVAESLASGEDVEANMINFLTGETIDGTPYHAIVVEGVEDGGIMINEMASHFFDGGSDGEVSNAKYNELVESLMDTVGDYPVPLHDIAAYPFNSVWDSGFPDNITKKFSKIHAIRPDIAIMACTQNVLEPINTPSEDSAAAVNLKEEFRAQQESNEFGTKALRFFLQSGSGYLLNSTYEGLVPFLEDTLYKVASYMGASNGEMQRAATFGRGGQNVISRYRDHNVISRKEGARNKDWSNGVTYAESYDIDRMFVAGYQSMYEDQTSVLHSLINMLIICNLHRIGHIAWRNWSGDSQLTDDEFLEEVESDVIRMTDGKFDGRVTIKPNAYKTKLDDDLGFSWHLDIDAGMENMRTVQHLAIIARRRRDME